MSAFDIEAAKRGEPVEYRGPFVSTCNKDQGPGPEQYEDWNSFIKWIHTDWQETEIEQ